MKLSMSILANHLSHFETECFIHNDELRIRGLRSPFGEGLSFSAEYVYLAPAQHFVSDSRFGDAYILVNGESRIIIFNCDYDTLFNETLSIFDLYNNWEGRMKDMADENAPIHQMAEITAEVIRNPFFIADIDGNVLFSTDDSAYKKKDAAWNYLTTTGRLPQESMTHELYNKDGQISDMTAYPQLLSNPAVSTPYLGMYLTLSGTAVAALCIHQVEPETYEKDFQLAEILSNYLIKAREFTFPASPMKPGALLIQDILAGNTVSEESNRIFIKHHFQPAWFFLLFQHQSRRDSAQWHLLNQCLSLLNYPYISLEYNSLFLILIPAEHFKAFLQELSMQYDLSFFRIGVSMPINNLNGIPAGFQQAKFALEVSNEKSGVLECKDYAYDYLISLLSEHELSQSLLHPALNRLISYDKKNNSDLFHTLKVFLICEKNLVNTAETLDIHRNTLKYRLSRIVELTDINFKSEKEMSYLRLSFWIFNHKNLKRQQ